MFISLTILYGKINIRDPLAKITTPDFNTFIVSLILNVSHHEMAFATSMFDDVCNHLGDHNGDLS